MIERWRLGARRLKRETYTLYLAYQSPATPWYAKVFAIGVVAYAFSPIDLIPDFIPVLGYLDDLILVPMGVSLALKMIPPQVLADCRAEAETTLAQGQPTNWWAALAIIAIWLLLAAIFLLLMLRVLSA
jgi:uncharacterized membrane protein YkvA (DUF1232 family)